MQARPIHIANLPLFMLFLGFVSTLGGAVWTLLYAFRMKAVRLSYPDLIGQGLEELVFSAFLHILLAAAVYFDSRRRENA